MLNVTTGVDTISNNNTMKSWLISILVGIFSVLTPLVPLFVTVTLLITADFIFGIIRAWKTKEMISSRKMGNTITKITLYNLCILVIFLVETYIIPGIPLTKLAAGVIAMVELKSVDESFQLLFGFSIYEKLKSKLQRGESETKDFKGPCPNSRK